MLPTRWVQWQELRPQHTLLRLDRFRALVGASPKGLMMPSMSDPDTCTGAGQGRHARYAWALQIPEPSRDQGVASYPLPEPLPEV
jgi:hypothetical protein